MHQPHRHDLGNDCHTSAANTADRPTTAVTATVVDDTTEACFLCFDLALAFGFDFVCGLGLGLGCDGAVCCVRGAGLETESTNPMVLKLPLVENGSLEPTLGCNRRRARTGFVLLDLWEHRQG
jgi:hypothetical protein